MKPYAAVLLAAMLIAPSAAFAGRNATPHPDPEGERSYYHHAIARLVFPLGVILAGAVVSVTIVLFRRMSGRGIGGGGPMVENVRTSAQSAPADEVPDWLVEEHWGGAVAQS